MIQKRHCCRDASDEDDYDFATKGDPPTRFPVHLADPPIRRSADPSLPLADTPTRRHAVSPTRFSRSPARRHAASPIRFPRSPTRRYAVSPTRFSRPPDLLAVHYYQSRFSCCRMTRRRSGTNWSRLRSSIESSLRQQPGFQGNFQLKEKIWILGDGLFHKSYAFEAGDQKLVLRLARLECGLQSRTEAIAGVRRESKTLQALQSLEFPFAIPELICLVTDDSGESIGLIESAVEGLPLNYLSRGFTAESQLKTIAQAASATHRLPKSKFTHLAQRADSRTHVLEELNVLPASLFGEFGEAAMAREWILCNLAEARTSTVLHGDLSPHASTSPIDAKNLALPSPALGIRRTRVKGASMFELLKYRAKCHK